jgi:hypothetical protein
MAKPDDIPMQPPQKCKARSKRTGLPCRNPPVRGWTVCRMHGARGGAQPGAAHPRFRHGGRTREAERLRAEVAELTRASRALLGRLEGD